MGERDAFGREQGEDTLAGLGWTSGATNADHPTQVTSSQDTSAASFGTEAVAAPVEAEAEPAAPRQSTAFTFDVPVVVPRRGRGRGRGCGAAVAVVLLLIVGAIVMGVSAITDAVEDADIASIIPDVSVPVTPATPATPAAAPVGLKRGSLLLRSNFERGLGRVRGAGGQLRSIRVEAERMDVQLKTKGGRLRNVQYRWGGEFQDLGASGPGFGFVDTVPFSRIDPSAPTRAVGRAAARLKTGAARVNYLVYTSGLSGWSVFFKGGQHFQTDDRGRIVRRVS